MRAESRELRLGIYPSRVNCGTESLVPSTQLQVIFSSCEEAEASVLSQAPLSRAWADKFRESNRRKMVCSDSLGGHVMGT